MAKQDITLEKYYPIEGRKDFFKYVIKTPEGLAKDWQGKTMYFDMFALEHAERVRDAIIKVRQERLENRPVIEWDAHLKETYFFKWLEKEHKDGANIDRFLDVIRRYFGGKQHPFKDRPDAKPHKYVYDYFIRKLYEYR